MQFDTLSLPLQWKILNRPFYITEKVFCSKAPNQFITARTRFIFLSQTPIINAKHYRRRISPLPRLPESNESATLNTNKKTGQHRFLV